MTPAQKPGFTLRRPIFAVFCFLSLLGAFNVLNFESNSTTLTLTPGRLEDEGIYDPPESSLEGTRSDREVVSELMI